jgi:hypothetical protein
MHPAWGSDIAVGAAEGKVDAVARDSSHAEGSMSEELRSRQERLGMLEVRKSDVRDWQE